MRKVQARWSVETSDDLCKDFIKADFGVDWEYISPVRWWQFWRWPFVFGEDYVLSRASELILIRKMTSSMKKAIDEDVVKSREES